MSFLTALTGVESRATAINGVHPRDPALLELFGGSRTVAGADITPANALRLSGWYAGVRILAECIASLPFITYRRLERGKERARKHPVYTLLHDAPNPHMTAVEFVECLQGNLLGWGNAFAEIERNGAGYPVALWPLTPNRVRLQVTPNRLWYYVRLPDGPEVQYREEDILHLRGLSSDGILGYGVVDLMRQTLGLAKLEEEYRARFFINDARPSGIIEYPGAMKDETYERYKRDWQAVMGGMENKFRIGFLEQGLKFHETQFTPEATQFIEGRKFQLEEIARILGIPLILLQSTEKATSWGTGIEQFMLAFVQFTIRPWLKRWEARCNYSLFTKTEREQYFVEALIEDLLRADSKTRAEVLQIWRRNGVINANGWLELENRNPIPGDAGETYIVEGNMTKLQDLGRRQPEPLEPS